MEEENPTSRFGIMDDASKFKEFLKENYNNRLTVMRCGNFVIFERPAIVFFHEFIEKYSELKDWLDLIYKVATHFAPESVQFGVADFEELPTFYASCNNLHLLGFDADIPPYVYAADSLDRLFQYEGNVTYDELVKFTQQLIDNKLWKTEPMPEESDEHADSNIKTIVASNFEKSIFENEKDVLVTFHTNYSFKYEYNLMGLAKTLVDDADNLVFYAYNAHENYLPLEYKIRELPTSMLIPRNAKHKRLLLEHHKYNEGYYQLHSRLHKFLAANVTTQLKKFERNGVPIDFEALKQKNLANFLKENYKNQIQILSENNRYRLRQPLLVFYHQFYEHFLQLKEWIDLLSKLAQQFSETIQFAVADLDNLSIFYKERNEVNLLGIENSTSPYVFALDINSYAFEYDGPITYDALSQYCELLVSNKLWKSEPVPDETPNCKIVQKLVASNCWDVIFKQEKDLLVTFYKRSSVWESTINQVIDELECDLDKLAFYKYNIEENYLRLDLKIDEFPTSMFIPHTDKWTILLFKHSDHLVYDNFTHPYYEELVAFLAKNASTELTNWDRNGQRREEKVIETSDE